MSKREAKDFFEPKSKVSKLNNKMFIVAPSAGGISPNVLINIKLQSHTSTSNVRIRRSLMLSLLVDLFDASMAGQIKYTTVEKMSKEF